MITHHARVHRAAPSVGERTDDAPARRPTRDGALLAALRPLTGGLAVLFALIAATKPLVVTSPSLIGIMVWQAALAGIFLGLHAMLRRNLASETLAHPLAAFIATLVLVDGIIHLTFIENPLETITFIIVALGLGIFMNRANWFAGMLALTFIAWTIGVRLAAPAPSDEWVYLGVFLVEASVLAALAYAGRSRTLTRLDEALASDADHRRGLTDALLALQESETRFRRLAENADDIIYRIRLAPERAFEYVSPAVTRILGVSPDAHYADANIWIDACDPRDAAKFAAALAGRSMELVEIRWVRSDSSVVWTQHRIVPVFDDAGHVIAVEGIARDVTVIKESEEDLRLQRDHLAALTEQLTEANEELSTFSYTVSHDLRAPLRGIDYFSQALWDEYAATLPREGLEYLTRVRSEAARLTRLVNELLQLSHVARVDPERGHVDLSEMARAITSTLRAQDPERVVDVRIESGLTAFADAPLAHVVLENLFQNAWKFTRETPNARIEFGAREEDGARTFFVRDNGVGFDMALSKGLFRPFHRMHSAARYEGTGIGLATVARVIQRHDGRVWAESRLGEGATFFFQFDRSAVIA